MNHHNLDWNRAALLNMVDAVIAVDAGAQVILINKAAERLTGWKQAESEGKPVSQVLRLANEQADMDLKPLLELVLQTGDCVSIGNHSSLLTRDGAAQLITGNVSPIQDDKGAIIGALFMIYTQSNQPKLGLSQEDLQLFIENAPVAIALFDRNMRYLATSRRWLEDYKISSDCLLGKSHYDIFPEIPQHWKIAHQQGLAGAVLHDEEQFVRDDGSVQWIHWVIQPWHESNGSIGGIVILTEDITERKELEVENKQLLEQFAAAQKMESIGRLAGGVAHDFNNMLNVILGHVSLTLLDIDSTNPLYEHLTEIHNAAERSAELTQQLLAFASRQVIAPKLLDLNETIEDMIKMLRRLIGEDIEFVWHPGAGLGLVKMDPSQVDQILANLCVNASDAISGIGKITLETKNIEFDEAFCAAHPGYLPGKYIMLAVSDTGAGMDETTLLNIFEPFFTTKKNGKGTGLGLATVYGIIKQNNGFIHVDSEPGTGSTFQLFIPRQQSGIKSKATRRTSQPPHGIDEVILLIDDEPMLSKVSKEILESLGYEVLVASSPREAIHIAQEFQGTIDLLVTDVVMPEMNGRDLYHNLKAIIANLKVLFMSGYTVNIIADHGVINDDIFFLQKPFSRNELAVKVRQIIEQD
ncbi:PAS domain S-box protein [uncultured Gimesia sp.]|uniref:hybrid sensor histidine kinase/response regulator n=1 Tax=uncultured Gimesia sp. TaxID=1678688 RepID=UPI0030DD8A08|tara:strand:- start:25898 stop:27814 length:1917 start_codon:yes stop_codon:yes gene_type:complete